ncbi:MAG: YncE family protein [Candidatus Riflebacteria bacterium]|nr:YncE family protein [Candidatus Riflebacteria bacterium]
MGLFVVVVAFYAMTLTSEPLPPAPPPKLAPWRTPVAVLLSPDGRHLYVANRDAGTVQQLSVEEGKPTGEVKVGRWPVDLAFSPTAREIYVTNHHGSSVSVIALPRFTVARTVPVNPYPWGVAVLREGAGPGAGRDVLYTTHTYENSLIKRDSITGQELGFLKVGRGAGRIVPSPDRKTLAVTALYSTTLSPVQRPSPEVDMVSPDPFVVVNRVFLPGANIVRGGAWTRDGDTLILPVQLPRNIIPDVTAADGWGMSHGLAILSRRGTGFDVRQVMLADAISSHAEPHDVAIDDAARRLYVAVYAASRVVSIDLDKLLTLVRRWPAADVEELACRLDLLHDYEVARLPVPANPRALALAPSGRTLFVACAFDDSVAAIDTSAFRLTRTIDLHPRQPDDQVRRGLKLFSSSKPWFRGFFSCSSCHPDTHLDGLVNDLAVDGLGRNRVDVRSLYGAAGTEPFKWIGSNAGFHSECGPRAARFIGRSKGFTDLELDDVVAYLRSLELPPNPYAGRPDLAEVHERGRQIFFRTVDTLGRPIKPRDQCAFCHPPPTFTNRRQFDVETAVDTDTIRGLDTVQLVNMFMSAPYLHDGGAGTLEEIFTMRNADDRHGQMNDLAKEDLNDLVAFMLSIGPSTLTSAFPAPQAPEPVGPPARDY